MPYLFIDSCLRDVIGEMKTGEKSIFIKSRLHDESDKQSLRCDNCSTKAVKYETGVIA